MNEIENRIVQLFTEDLSEFCHNNWTKIGVSSEKECREMQCYCYPGQSEARILVTWSRSANQRPEFWEMQWYCDIFRSSKHQQFVLFSEQTFPHSEEKLDKLDILLQFISFRAEANLFQNTWNGNWAAWKYTKFQSCSKVESISCLATKLSNTITLANFIVPWHSDSDIRFFSRILVINCLEIFFYWDCPKLPK